MNASQPVEYIGMARIASHISARALEQWRAQSAPDDTIANSAITVSRHAVSKWRERYPADSARPFPLPDVTIDGAPGWLESRLGEIEQWRQGLPGQGWRKGPS